MDKDGGKEGEGEMNGESSMEAYTLTYVKQPMEIYCMTKGTQIRALNNLEGWESVGGGKEVQEGGDIRIPMADSC